MFCGKCGAKLRDDAQFCQKCGTPFTKKEAVPQKAPQEKPPSEPESQPVQQVVYQTVYQPVYQPQPRPYYPPGTHPYHKLGGFLLCHVVCGYIAGISSFISIATNLVNYCTQMKLSGSWPGSITGFMAFNLFGSIILNLSVGCVSITYSNKIRRKESDVLHFWQYSYMVIMIVQVIFWSIEFALMQGILKQYRYTGAITKYLSVGTIVLMIVVGAVGLLLGSLYYARSVRVRTYMGSDEYLRKSVFNQNTVSPIPADGSDQPGVVNPNVAVSFDPEKQWYCTQCGRVNENYTPTCYCGMVKPSGDLSKSWICQSCGKLNMGNLHRCTFCGREKHRETDWNCPKCGSRNRSNESVCFVCGTTNPSAKKGSLRDIPKRNDWVCPECGTINAYYIGTCGCGRRKP